MTKEEDPRFEENVSSFAAYEEKVAIFYRTRPKEGSIIFRGQSDATWGLIPSLFRNTKSELTEKDEIDRLLKTEMSELKDFVTIANRAGISLPGDYTRLINIQKSLNVSDDAWADVGKNPHLQIIAIAQHHGIQTRFLDFTTSAHVALYFAAADSAKKQLLDGSYKLKFCVWMIDGYYLFNPSCDTTLINIPYVQNHYLQAQRGCFLTASFYKNHRYVLDLKTRMDENLKDMLKEAPGLKDYEPIIQKLMFEAESAFEILKELEARGIHMASLKPDLSTITPYKEFKKNIGEKVHEIEKRNKVSFNQGGIT